MPRVAVTITIRPEDERLIADALETGAYSDPGDVVTRALRVLRSEDAWLAEKRTEIGEKIERARAQLERGEFFSAEESRAEMDRRKADWLREHRA